MFSLDQDSFAVYAYIKMEQDPLDTCEIHCSIRCTLT